ncbi:hypothetical protein LguiB_019795 [Lonicera macranthoides]
MADVPLDILINHIFIRLPATSLLSCRCVCKQWLGLLTDPEFMSMHFKHQKIHNHQQLLFRPRFCNMIKRDVGVDYYAKFKALHGVFYSIDLQSSSSNAVRLPGFQPKDYDLKQTLGCCDGMVCMEVLRRNYIKEDYWKSKHLLFGNPCTGDYKILPEPIISPLFVGFGYDSYLDDYRFVRVDYVTRNPHIFSLKLNSWRTIFGSSDNYSIKPELYYEEFRELPLPLDMRREERKSKLSMKDVGGSLCVVKICKNNEVTVWLMLKEEENNIEKYCWVKLMMVTLPAIYFGRFFYFYPLSFMKDGKVLCSVLYLIDGENLVKFVLIDPKTKRLEEFAIHGICDDSFGHCTFEAQHTAYIDSLVSPN